MVIAKLWVCRKIAKSIRELRIVDSLSLDIKHEIPDVRTELFEARRRQQVHQIPYTGGIDQNIRES